MKQLESLVKDDSFEKNGIRKFILSHIPEDYKNDDIEGIVEVFYQRLRALKCGEKGLGSVSHKFNIGDTIKMPSGVTAKIIGFVDGDKYKIEFDNTVSERKKIAVYFWKLEEKAVLSDDYHVGDLITYKGYEETIFKIVAIKGNNYIVVEIGDRTRTKNKIPFADNDKLQRAVSPLLITEAKLAKNNKEVKVGDEFIKPKEWELPNAWLSDNIKDKYDLFCVSYVHPDGTIFLYDEQSGKTERYTQSEFYQLGLQFYKHYSKDNGISGTSENLIQDFQENIWKNGFNSVTLRQLDNIIDDIQNGRIQIETENARRMARNYHRPRSSRNAIASAVICGREGRAYPQISFGDKNYFKELERSERYQELLEQWAKYDGCWVNNLSNFDRDYKLIGEGSEAKVYDVKTEESHSVFKVIDLGMSASLVQRLIERIYLHNCLFGDSTHIDIIGFGRNENGYFKLIVEQPYIDGRKVRIKRINKFLLKKFPDLTQVSLVEFYNNDFKIKDLHNKNVLKDNKGNFYVIDCFLSFNNNELDGISGVDESTPKITDKGDDFSYFNYPKDVIDKFYTYIRITGLDKNIPAFSNYFFDDDGHLCFATSRKEEIEEGIDVNRCLKKYEDLKHEWIAKAEDNINGFIWQFFINDTEFSPRGSYNYKILNRDLVELLLGYARKFEETSEIYPDKLGVENLQDYNKTKEILTKRLAELNKPKQPKKTPTIPTVQPERLLTFDRNRLSMSCVHCENGYKVVTDAHCILKFKSDYPKQYEGKNVMPKHFFKKFEEFILNPETVLFCNEGSYPNYEPVIKNTLAKTKYYASIDIQSLYQYICALTDYYEKQTGEEIKVENRHRVPLFYNGQHAFSMDIVRLKKWLSAAKLIQADTIKWVDYSYGVVFQNSKSDNGEILLIMPHYRDDVPTITDGKCLIDVDWDIWYKPYDFANTRKANILITEAKLCKIKSK